MERLAGGDIDGYEITLAAVGLDLGKALLGLFRDPPAEHHFRAGAGKSDCNGAAKFAGAADDHGGFSGEIE